MTVVQMKTNSLPSRQVVLDFSYSGLRTLMCWLLLQLSRQTNACIGFHPCIGVFALDREMYVVVQFPNLHEKNISPQCKSGGVVYFSFGGGISFWCWENFEQRKDGGGGKWVPYCTKFFVMGCFVFRFAEQRKDGGGANQFLIFIRGCCTMCW